jgi:hypothetical protein
LRARPRAPLQKTRKSFWLEHISEEGENRDHHPTDQRSQQNLHGQRTAGGHHRCSDKSQANTVAAYSFTREAGHGSLGQQRFVAIAHWCGAVIAREAKATLPSSCVWLNGNVAHGQPYHETVIKSGVRSRDPYQKMEGTWLIRRLSPDANPIEIEDLAKTRDEEVLLHAMGAETANVHLGTPRQRKRILRDLQRRKSGWLGKAAKEMAKATERDWKKYRRS